MPKGSTYSILLEVAEVAERLPPGEKFSLKDVIDRINEYRTSKGLRERADFGTVNRVLGTLSALQKVVGSQHRLSRAPDGYWTRIAESGVKSSGKEMVKAAEGSSGRLSVGRETLFPWHTSSPLLRSPQRPEQGVGSEFIDVFLVGVNQKGELEVIGRLLPEQEKLFRNDLKRSSTKRSEPDDPRT